VPEPDIDTPLFRRLIAVPRRAGLPITRVPSAGTDNAIYRLGDDMAVRLPRRPWVAATLTKEQDWLPRLAPFLLLAVPVRLAPGTPWQGFPFPWGVYQWLDGSNAADEPDIDLPDAAVRRGRFVAALERIDTTGGPPSFRGGPVSMLDDRVRGEIRDLGTDSTLDPGLAIAAWETALATPEWDGDPVWVHADLSPLNLLVRHRRLTAVIDFGGLASATPPSTCCPPGNG
jgi:aminoglycoside phosphotransferase (APT) family kinase protein